MLRGSIGQVQPTFFDQIPKQHHPTFHCAEKNAVFSTSLIIIELSFWVVATKVFSRRRTQSVWVALSSLNIVIKNGLHSL